MLLFEGMPPTHPAFEGYLDALYLGSAPPALKETCFPHLPTLFYRALYVHCHVAFLSYTDYAMPFMIQYLRNLHEKVEAVDARTKVRYGVMFFVFSRLFSLIGS